MSENKDKVNARLLELIEGLKKDLAEKIGNIVWTACNDYVEYAEYEPLENLKDRLRDELVKEKYYMQESIWGKIMRQTILTEHKDELQPLLQNELILKLQEENKRLVEQVSFLRRCQENRY